MRLRPIIRLLCALLLTVLGACNAIRLEEARLRVVYRAAGLRDHVEPVGGAQIAYWDGGNPGERPPLLLIHGFGAHAIWQWPAQVREFASDRRVVVPDLLWFGESRPASSRFGLLDQEAAIAALLDRLQLDRVDVVGISYGGLVAYTLAAHRPERVGKLVLIDSPGKSFEQHDYEALLDRFSVTDPGSLLVPDTPEGARRLVELAYAKPPLVPRLLLRQVIRDLYADARDEKVKLLTTVVEDADALRADPREPAGPVLLIWGDDDPVFPPEIARRLHGSLGDRAELLFIEDARHAPQLEHPREVNRRLREFLDGGE